MKRGGPPEVVSFMFIAIVCILLTIYIFEHLALNAYWAGDLNVDESEEAIFKAIVEQKLFELSTTLFIIFSIIITVLGVSFDRRLDRRIEEARNSVTESAFQSSLNSYQAVSANIFHEMAFKTFDDVEEVTMLCWHHGEFCLTEQSRRRGEHLVEIGLHYSRRGLEHLSRHSPNHNDTERLKRVPGHLRNSFLWLSGARIVFCGTEEKSYYEYHFEMIRKLYNFVHDTETPERPSWYQAYESIAFFLVNYGKSSGDKNKEEEGLEYIRSALGGAEPGYNMGKPSSEWVSEVRKQYRKAGYDV